MFCGPWMNWKRVTVKGSGSCFQDWEERLAEQQSSSGEFGAVSVWTTTNNTLFAPLPNGQIMVCLGRFVRSKVLGMELRQGNHKDVGPCPRDPNLAAILS